jgi:hypothetical protein
MFKRWLDTKVARPIMPEMIAGMEMGWRAAMEEVKSHTVANAFITKSMPDTRLINMKIIDEELST